MTTRTKRKPPSTEALALTGKQRSHLRALAHAKNPIVQIGHAGLTASVMKQVDEALQAHELIKIKVGREAPIDAAAAAQAIIVETRAALAQIVGRIAILYRPHPTEPSIVLPKKAAARSAKRAVSKRPG